MNETFGNHMPSETIHPLVVDTDTFTMNKALTIFISVIVMGIIAGFVLASVSKKSTSTTTENTTNTTTDTTKMVGIKDKSTFKDSSEGILQEGGLKGEGSYHLVRPGGDSQTIYLTSATVDMSAYVGKKVKIFGQTINSNVVGWLMDVGAIEPQ